MKATVFLLFILLLISEHSFAATRRWTGNAFNGRWSSAGNWSPNGIPGPTDDLVFPLDETSLNDLVGVNVRSLSFTDEHTINGNPIGVAAGISVTIGSFGTDDAIINAPLTLVGSPTFAVGAGQLLLNGGVNLNGQGLTLDPGTDTLIQINGVISGTGNITKIFDGTVELSGPTANTYAGTFAINRGLLRLNKDAGNAITGRLVIGTGLDVATVELLQSHQLADNAPITINQDSLLHLNGHTEIIGPLIMGGGQIQTRADSTGTLFLKDDVTAIGGNSEINGLIQVSFDITFDCNPGSLTLGTNIFGPGRITKVGPGTLTLLGDNSFTGEVLVNNGTLAVRGIRPLGATSGGVTVTRTGPFGQAKLSVNATVSGEVLRLEGDSGWVTFGGGGWLGPIELNIAGYATFQSGSVATLSGPVTGPGGILFQGYVFELSGGADSSYTGATVVGNEFFLLNKTGGRPFAGDLFIGTSLTLWPHECEVRWLRSAQIPVGTLVRVETNGLVNLNGFTDTFERITMRGGRVETGAGTLSLLGHINSLPHSASALINGNIHLTGQSGFPATHTFTVGDGAALNDLEIAGVIDGTIFASLTKTGPGRMRLSGPNTFGGLLTVLDGIVAANHDSALGATSGGTVVRDDGTLLLDAGAGLVRELLTLQGNGFHSTNGAVRFAGGLGSIIGNIYLESPVTIRADVPAAGILSGVISGNGPLTKIGNGTVQLGGGFGLANTYAGDTLVNAGTLVLSKPAGVQAVPGNLVVGSGGFSASPATARHFQTDQIWSNVVVNAGSLLDLNGYDEYLGRITLNNGGDVQTGSGTLYLAAGTSLVVNPSFTGNDPANVSGRLGLFPGNHTFEISPFSIFTSNAELHILANVVNAPGTAAHLAKEGLGQMRLSGSNGFAGTLRINEGRVTAAHNNALGSIFGTTIVNGDGWLALDGGRVIAGEALTLNTAASGALASLSGSNTWTGTIQLSREATVSVNPASGYLQVLNEIFGVGGLRKIGAGTLQFRGATANTYAGLTVVSNGVLECGRVDQISVPGDALIGDGSTTNTTATLRVIRDQQFHRRATVTIERSGLLDLFPVAGLPRPHPTVRRIPGSGKVNLGSLSSLTISNDVSFLFIGAISGSGALHKYGSETMHMTGQSPFTGPTTLFEGDYQMDGGAPNSPLTIKPDGRLSGDGVLGHVTVEANGRITPVSTVRGRHGGDLEMSSVYFDPGGLLGLNLWGEYAVGTNESLIVNGPVNLNGAILTTTRLLHAPREGDVITLIHKRSPGSVVGTFDDYPQGALRTLGDIRVVMSYTGGDGNDVTITVTNLAAQGGGHQVVSGNGNGLVEPNECNLLFLGVRNRRSTPITISNAVLHSLTLGAVVTIGRAAYPIIPAMSTATNITPFQIRTDDSLQCGEPVALELHLTVVDEGTFAIPFTAMGGTDCSNTGGGCESCIIVDGRFRTNSTTTLRMPAALGAPSLCLPLKPCPSAPLLNNPVRYVTHVFRNTTETEVCITAQLHYECPSAPADALRVAAYLDSFPEDDGCTNYLGDAGVALPSGYAPFSFVVPAGARFVIVVFERMETPSCRDYWLEIFGLPCGPPSLRISGETAPNRVVVQWSTAYPEWRLQSSTLVSPPYQNVGVVPSIVNSQFTVTNNAGAAARYYRLRKP